MGEVPLHPAIVHIPLGLSLVLPLVAVGVTVALWRAWISRSAGGELVYLHGAAAVYAQPVGATIGDASRKPDDD